jgi:hypothetical protein
MSLTKAQTEVKNWIKSVDRLGWSAIRNPEVKKELADHCLDEKTFARFRKWFAEVCKSSEFKDENIVDERMEMLTYAMSVFLMEPDKRIKALPNLFTEIKKMAEGIKKAFEKSADV